MMPRISVVMPLYNKECEVGRAISSVLAQSFRDFELIVVDDGSTDSSVDQVATFGDPRIRLIRQTNRGVSAARNKGVDEARTDLVAFIDADDEWLPGFLDKIVSLRGRYPEAKVYATSYIKKSDTGAQWLPVLNAEHSDFREGILENYFGVAARSDPPVWSSAVAVEKDALMAINGFPEGIRCGEDLLTWARLAIKWPIAYSRAPLSIFWMPMHVSERPGRFEDAGDPVGYELRSLYNKADLSRCEGIRQYVAMWHRMRAVTSLQLNRRIDCLCNVWRSVRLGGIEPRVAIIGMLAVVPYPDPGRFLPMLRKWQARKQ